MSRTGQASVTRSPTALVAAALALALVTGCVGSGTGSSSADGPAGQWSPRNVAATGASPCRTVAVAAGDIVNSVTAANRTGRVAQAQRPHLVLVLGDNQYDDGALEDYRAEYDRTAWGALKTITNPVPGNHEYRTEGAAGYFAYFGDPPPYYAYDAGCGWRGYALNSETDIPEQAEWLRQDLAAHPRAPVLLSWHRPRFSSGVEHGGDPELQPFWDALTGRRGIVLNGHEHHYERFRPVGRVREFVVGTGGTSTYPFDTPAAGSQVRLAGTPGVLRLDLLPRGYEWSFLTVDGAVADRGRD